MSLRLPVIDRRTFNPFCGRLTKLAALSEDEAKHLEKLKKQRDDLMRLSYDMQKTKAPSNALSKGAMNDLYRKLNAEIAGLEAQTKSMSQLLRENSIFQRHKKPVKKIDLNLGSVVETITKHPGRSLAAYGLLLGAGREDQRLSKLTSKEKRTELEKAKREGVGSELLRKFPRSTKGLLTASALGGLGHSIKTRSLSPLVLGAVGGPLALYGAAGLGNVAGRAVKQNKSMAGSDETAAERDERNRKRREEYARDKPLHIVKPTGGAPAVSKPKKAA